MSTTDSVNKVLSSNRLFKMENYELKCKANKNVLSKAFF